MNKDYDILEQAVEAFSQSSVPAGPSDDLVRRTLEQIEKQQSNLPLMERILKMKSLTKIAAAAVVIIGISAVFLFPTGGQSIALAAVYEKVQQAQAFMYKMSMTITGIDNMMGMPGAGGPMEMDVTVVISEDYGMKMENHMQVPGPNGETQNLTQLAYLLPEEKTMISIIPEQKMYQTIEFTYDLLEQTKKQNNDPREMIKQMLDCEYVELEPTEIDGIKVQGFQTMDPAYLMGVAGEVRATLWVDVETWMPVKSEISAKIAEMETTYVIDRFQWDVPVTAADFEYHIPDDYKEMGSMKMPEMNGEAAVEGLKNYSKVFGEYPEKIDIGSLVPSLMKQLKELRDNPKTDYAKELVEKMESAGDDQEKIQQFTQDFTTPITSLAMFHMKLVQDKKDLAYYGDRVTPEDTDAVLMRWKNDEGTYTVVFGDLTIAEMAYEDLSLIEPQAESNLVPTEPAQP